MPFRSISASLSLDVSGYRRALNDAATDTRRLIAQLQGISNVAGLDGVTGDVHQLDRALGDVPDAARHAGSSAASAFDGFESELEQLDDRARAVAREQGQIADAAAEASRRAGGAYRTIGTEAAQAAASARGSMSGLAGATTGVVASAEEAALAEGQIGAAALRSGAEARGALSGVAGSHSSIISAAERAGLAEAGIGSAAVSAAELAQAAALQAAEALGVITSAAERAAAAEALVGAAAEKAAAQSLAASRTGASGGGPVPVIPGGGGKEERGLLGSAVAATHTVRSIAFTVAGFEGIVRMTRGLREAVTGASDLNESLNKTRFVFGQATPVVVGLANEMRDRFGQSRTAILDAAANFGLIGKAANLAEPETANLSAKLARLAVDAQSFFNVPLPEVLGAFRSGLVGEAEPMRRFGVLLDEASVKSHAYAMGIASVGAELTQAQKVQSRFDLILNAPALKAAEGDMERTADQFANRMRIIGGRIKEWAVDVGTSAIPSILHLVDVLEQAGRSAAPTVAAAFEKIGEALRRLQPFFSSMVEIGGNLWQILVDLAKAFGPFAAALAAIGGGAAIAALNGISAALREITGFLAENEDLVRALAIAYGVTLVPRLASAAAGISSMAIATARLTVAQSASGASGFFSSIVSIGPAAVRSGAMVTGAAGTSAASLGAVETAAVASTVGITGAGNAGLVMGGKVSAGADAAAISLGRLRVGWLGVGAVAAAAVVVAQHFFSTWQKEGRKQFTDQFGKNFLKTNDLQTLKNTREELRRERMQLEHELNEPPKNATPQQQFQAEKDKSFDVLRPRKGEGLFGHAASEIAEQTRLRDKLREVNTSYDDVDNKIKKITETRRKEAETVKQVAAQTGASAREVARVMAEGGIKGDDAQAATAAVVKLQQELDGLARQARVDGPALAAMFGDSSQAAVDFLKVVVDVGQKVKGAFLSDVDVTTHVNADPKAIADAQKQVAELAKSGKPIPVELQLQADGPLDQLRKFYANAVKMGQTFSDNARKALTLGFDPDLIQRLMLQGPEKAGPLLAALVSKSGASLVGMVNTQEAELRRQSAVIEEIATKQLIDTTLVQTLTTKAVEDQSGKRTVTLGNAIKVQRAMLLIGEGATYDQVKMITGLKTGEIQKVVDAWGFKLFAAIDSTVARYQPRPAVQGGAGRFQAAGGIEDHTPRVAVGGGPIVWNERVLPWEGFVSGHPRYFNRSESIMGDIAHRLGGRYLPSREARKQAKREDVRHFAAGGVVAHLDRDTVRLADGAVVSRHEWTGGRSSSSRVAPRSIHHREREMRSEHYAAGGVRSSSSLIDRLRERFVERFAAGGVNDQWKNLSVTPRSNLLERNSRSRESRTEQVTRHRLGNRGVSSTVRGQDHVLVGEIVGVDTDQRGVRDRVQSPAARNGRLGRNAFARHAPTVRRFAAGGIADSLPQVPLEQLAQYNVGPQGAGKRALDATTVMRETAVNAVNAREHAVNAMRLAAAGNAAQGGAGGPGIGTGHIGQGWGAITQYLATHGVNFIVTSTTGGNHVKGSYHYRGKAADLVGTGRSSMSMIFDSLAGVGSSLAELFYDPKGWYIKNGARVKGAIGGHSDHVHAATFRQGGVVAPALPRQRPWEPERIRRVRDTIEHGPLGFPRRPKEQRKIVGRAAKVVGPAPVSRLRPAMHASGGVAEVRVAGLAQPDLRFAFGGITAPAAVRGGVIRERITGDQSLGFEATPSARVMAHPARASKLLQGVDFPTPAAAGQLLYGRPNGAQGFGAARVQGSGRGLPSGHGESLRRHASGGLVERVARFFGFATGGTIADPSSVTLTTRTMGFSAIRTAGEGKANYASGGVAPSARWPNLIDGADQLPRTTGARNRRRTSARAVATMAEQRQLFHSLGIQGRAARRADARGQRDERLRPGPSLRRFDVQKPNVGAPGHASGGVVGGRGVGPQRERHGTVRQRRDLRDHAHAGFPALERDAHQFPGLERKVGVDRRDRPRSTHSSTVDRRTMRVGGFDLAAARLPSFAQGGTVPGRPGEARVIIAHGGEQVAKPDTIRLNARGGAAGGSTVSVKIDMPLHMDNARFGGEVTLADLQSWHDRAVEKAQDEVLNALEGVPG